MTGASQADWGPSSAELARVDQWLAMATSRGSKAALLALSEQLRTAPPEVWLGYGRVVLQRGYSPLAAALLDLALLRQPASTAIRYWLARAAWQAGDTARAESGLRRLLAGTTDTAAAMLLGQVLRSQGKLDAAAGVLAERTEAVAGDGQAVVEWAQFMRECQRQDLALGLCERELARGNADPQLEALAGNLAQELGRFEQARGHYLDAIGHGIDLNLWFVLGSLASIERYRDRRHPDFALFESHVRDPALSPRARAAILFAQGKAFDDIGEFASAADAWREANALRHLLGSWSPTTWRDFVAARLASAPMPARHADAGDITPVFVVGLPRTGTTLVAELLGRHPDIRNRGELPTLPYLAERLAGLDAAQRAAALDEAATIYMTHLRRDDAPARCYIDKNPLNFRYLDTVAALFPNARVIHCRRQARDTALSIWSQSFAHDDYAFAADFHDIAALANGCDALMAHWQRSLPIPIITVDYEQIAADPTTAIGQLVAQLGLAPLDPAQTGSDAPSAITSASQWQARQPIHQHSIERWRNYADDLPELIKLFPA
jgi:tetratricopeptide (TPR) repeat protein